MPEPLRTLAEFLERFAPLDLAESWDNVGLLVGSLESEVIRVMTCLTLTPDVAAEAASGGADLVVAHHPLLFRPVQKLTSETIEGRLLLDLIRHGIAVYSPHTAFDGAQLGVNQQLAESLGLTGVTPIRPREVPPDGFRTGGGRYGDLETPLSLREFLIRVQAALGVSHLHFVGEPARTVSRVGVACGSAAEFLPDAVALGCDLLLTGEARFHACLEARSLGTGLVLAGHYATERPAVERLASLLQERFPSVTVWASRKESDPVQWFTGKT